MSVANLLKAMNDSYFEGTLNVLYGGTKLFCDASAMLQCIVDGRDLYCPKTGAYVFLYNNQASIAVYNLSREDVSDLIEKQTVFNESWSENLGQEGTIYDDCMYTNGEGLYLMEGDNKDWCNSHLFDGDWYFVEKIILNEEKENENCN